MQHTWKNLRVVRDDPHGKLIVVGTRDDDKEFYVNWSGLETAPLSLNDQQIAFLACDLANLFLSLEAIGIEESIDGKGNFIMKGGIPA